MANRIERRCAAGHEWIDNVPGRLCPYCSTGSTGSTRTTSPASSTGSTSVARWQQLASEQLSEPVGPKHDELCRTCDVPLVWTRAQTMLWCRPCNTLQLPAHVHERQSARTAPATRERDPMTDERATQLLAHGIGRLRWDLTQLARMVGDPADAASSYDASQLAGWLGEIEALRSRPISSQTDLERVRKLTEEFRVSIYQRNREIQRRAVEVEPVWHQGNGHQNVIEGEVIEPDGPRELTAGPTTRDERRTRQWADMQRFGICELCSMLDRLTSNGRCIVRYEVHSPAVDIKPVRVCEKHKERAIQRLNGWPIQVTDLHEVTE